MPKVSPQHLEARRREILEAAWRCFGRKGFHETTMRDICDEAQLSAGAVYRYFTGKADLIKTVAEAGRRRHRARAIPVAKGGNAAEAMAESLARFLDCLDDPEALPSLRVDVRLLAEAVHESHVRAAVLENYGSLLDLLTPLVKEGQRQGTIDPALSPRAAARLALAMLLGLELQKAADPKMKVGPCIQVASALFRGTFTRPARTKRTR
jgi:AcrR family transcriptional regulator